MIKKGSKIVVPSRRAIRKGIKTPTRHFGGGFYGDIQYHPKSTNRSLRKARKKK